MSYSDYRITLDVRKTVADVRLNAKKGDTGRRIYITLSDGSKPCQIGEGCYAVFAGVKPDGTRIYHPTTIVDNTIIYDMTQQTVAVPGLVACEVKLFNSMSDLLTSPKLTILVDDVVVSDEEIASKDEVTALAELISEVQAAKVNANQAAETILQAKEEGVLDGVFVTHEWEGTRLKITSASGTSSAELKGDKGSSLWADIEERPAVNPGTGEDAVVIGQGEAAGDYSVAEGLNTRAMGVGAHAEGANNVSLSRAGHAEGSNNQIGSKAFTILAVDKANKTYTLDDTTGLQEAVDKGYLYSCNVCFYKTGNGEHSSTQKEHYGKITAINGNIVTVDPFYDVTKEVSGAVFETKDSYIVDDMDTEENTFRVIDLPNVGTRTIGDSSHVEGDQCKTLSKDAHAEGFMTLAYGSYAHVEGNRTKAGFGGHAEGRETTASGKRAHAEGFQTTASGANSHSEGYQTTASGEQSHAEGSSSVAQGYSSHAENNGKAYGANSHAEGSGAMAYGKGSHAEGELTEARGDFSHAEGGSGAMIDGSRSGNTVATGKCSHAEGRGSTASGLGAHAEGLLTVAEGRDAHAEGQLSTASGSGSHAEGYQSKTYANNSHAEGNNTVAGIEGEPSEAVASHAEGQFTIASGKASHAEGIYCQARSKASHAEGYYTLANEYWPYVHVQGKYNSETYGRPWTSDTMAHVVGNGAGNDSRSNAHSLDWKGNAWFCGEVSGTGADYAEYFEWADGNPNNEDRVGLIVALDGDKIRPANSGDDILGVVSGTAMVVGDNAEWEWQGKYLCDDYGRVIWEMVEEFDNEGESIGFFPHRQINPDYDPKQEYVRRVDRSEWDTVGLVGKLHVTDDGSCAAGGYAAVGENGIATASIEKTNMRVMKRITDSIVLVFMK